MMAFPRRHQNELDQILSAGGGLILDAQFINTAELCVLAAAARKGSARLELTGLHGRHTSDLLMIATAGGGLVVFS